MDSYNQTFAGFILLGFFPPSKIGLFLFILVVLIFLTAWIGNLSMILLILLDSHLHTLMYFLLSQLSLIDLNYISTIVPKMLYDFILGNKHISFIGCGFQIFLFLTFGGTETLLLASMAYDHYVTICFPLQYATHMNKRVCVMMITGAWVLGSINSCAHTGYALQIPYCRSRAINHFFCDIPVMLTLACMDTWVYEYTVFVSTMLFLVFPFIGIVCSYGHVFLAVYHMHSGAGKKKFYSTCSTHLTVVTFYYEPFAYTNLHPSSLQSPAEDQILAVFYTVLTPMFNPVIYSLRSKEVMGALRRMTHRICFAKI